MKNSLFNSENWLWQPFAVVADVLILSCLWLLCCVPILTAGAASAALYDCCARCVRGGEKEMFGRFFRTFRRELKLGSASFLIWGAILGGGLNLIRAYTANAEGTDPNVALAYALVALLAMLVGICAWVFPLLSRFTFSFSGLQTTALKLAILHLPRTLALMALVLAGGWICLRMLLPVMVVPAMVGIASTFLLEPVFQTYETGAAGENT